MTPTFDLHILLTGSLMSAAAATAAAAPGTGHHDHRAVTSGGASTPGPLFYAGSATLQVGASCRVGAAASVAVGLGGPPSGVGTWLETLMKPVVTAPTTSGRDELERGRSHPWLGRETFWAEGGSPQAGYVGGSPRPWTTLRRLLPRWQCFPPAQRRRRGPVQSQRLAGVVPAGGQQCHSTTPQALPKKRTERATASSQCQQTVLQLGCAVAARTYCISYNITWCREHGTVTTRCAI